ncbi:MAG: hypothetical protein CME05_04515 [Gemmatimonadaceae bacterium]|nr:hypothetical protein [Gemmatimonadaceae bacterium]MEC8931193.1 hypothetical protein [Candidatus Latescibacterota bacterium]MEE3264614.1 hypothetical protein [Candidatus Latescibacterota bacterium]
MRRSVEMAGGFAGVIADTARLPLPPIRTDPLERRDRGRKLATWRADLSRGIFYLTLRGSEMHFEHIYGRQPEGQASAVLSAIDHDETWRSP